MLLCDVMKRFESFLNAFEVYISPKACSWVFMPLLSIVGKELLQRYCMLLRVFAAIDYYK